MPKRTRSRPQSGVTAKSASAREAKRLRTRRRVLDAALEVFRENAFEEATTAAIARLAGVSHGTVFTVAPTKERLAAAAFDVHLRQAGESAFSQALAVDAPLIERFMLVFDALFEFYAEHRSIARVLLRDMLLSVNPHGGESHDRLLKDYLSALQLLLHAAAHRQELPADADAEALAATLLGVYLVFLLAQLNEAYPDRDSHRSMCRRALRAVLASSADDRQCQSW